LPLLPERFAFPLLGFFAIELARSVFLVTLFTPLSNSRAAFAEAVKIRQRLGFTTFSTNLMG
jgi:hypothetical protein